MMKRLFDFVVASAGLIVLFPLLLIVAIAIKLTSPGPIFYRGVRTGRFGVPFRVFKFRTMVINAEALGGPSTGQDDPRLTRIGGRLRKFKIDELPNLINVVLGQMSLVGPRPEVQQYTSEYTDEEKIILDVRPGITDLSSVEFIDLQSHIGTDDVDANFEKHVLPKKNKLRVKYVKTQSFLGDLRILYMTFSRLVFRK